MKLVERIVMVLLLLVLIGGAAWLYFSVTNKQQAVRDAVARGDYEIRDDAKDDMKATKDISTYYSQLIPIQIGSTSVQASVADSLSERIQGLSDTPGLPEGVVKLFVFGSGGEQSIWMKDMEYALDIIWANKEGKIVHIEKDIAPETYPNSFASPIPAWYVIEANAGFVASTSIKKGDMLIIGS